MSLEIQDGPEAPSPSGQKVVIIAVVVAISTLAAFVLDATQSRPLGDAPLTMIVVGCFISIVTSVLRLGRPLHLGLAAMAGFPVWAVIDLGLNGGHDLLPIEFAFYAAYGGLGVLVATIVRALRA